MLKSVPKFGNYNEEIPTIPGIVPNPNENLHGCYFLNRCDDATKECETKYPEKIKDPNNNIGPENKQTKAVTASPPIFLLIGFAITIPSDHANAPTSSSKTPINFP